MMAAIVAKIDQDPSGLETARRNLRLWPSSPALDEWRRLMKKPWTELREILLDPSQEGRRLRQSHPFVGILTSQERGEISK